jgi:hypothetical protein
MTKNSHVTSLARLKRVQLTQGNRSEPAVHRAESSGFLGCKRDGPRLPSPSSERRKGDALAEVPIRACMLVDTVFSCSTHNGLYLVYTSWVDTRSGGSSSPSPRDPHH